MKSSIKIGDWGERFVLVNGGCSSGKWLPGSEPVEVNNVNMAIARGENRGGGGGVEGCDTP